MTDDLGDEIDDASVWDERAFRARVRAAGERVGLQTDREICEKAGLAADYLGKTPRRGRNIAAILKIARALDADPAALIGLPPASYPPQIANLRLIANIATHLYLAMSACPADLTVDPAKVARQIATMMMAADKKPD